MFSPQTAEYTAAFDKILDVKKAQIVGAGAPVWKVCIVQPRSRLRSFDVPYIFYSKFLKSRARNLQTFQSGRCAKQLPSADHA